MKAQGLAVAVVVAALALQGCAGGAPVKYAPGAIATTTSPAPATSKSNDLVCTDERPIGSHLPVRTCRTRAQVAEQSQAAQQTLQKTQQTQGGTH